MPVQGTIPVDEIIGKTLYAKKRVAIFRHPQDGEQVMMFIDRGQPVGVVHSYLQPTDRLVQRSHFYWMFRDPNGRFYYARHDASAFSGQRLRDQGAETTRDRIERERHEALPWYERLGNKALAGGGLLFGGYLLIKALK